MTPARPIGSYQHPKPRHLHAGYQRRIETYLRGGLNAEEVARLVGVHDSHIRQLRIKHGWRAEGRA